MGRIELVFIGTLLGVLLVIALSLFGDVMIQVGKQRILKELKKQKGVKKT